MANGISPQEFHLLQDNPIIRTKCPQELLTDEMVLSRVKNGNLAAGDIVRVQCMNHDLSELLAECEYRVTSRKSELKTYQFNDRDSRQVDEITFKVERWSDWRMVKRDGEKDLSPVPQAPGGISGYGTGLEMKSAWNPGRRGWEIKIGNEVVGFSTDKEEARKMAAGDLPLSMNEAA